MASRSELPRVIGALVAEDLSPLEKIVCEEVKRLPDEERDRLYRLARWGPMDDDTLLWSAFLAQMHDTLIEVDEDMLAEIDGVVRSVYGMGPLPDWKDIPAEDLGELLACWGQW
jgi:hypothetical protein